MTGRERRLLRMLCMTAGSGGGGGGGDKPWEEMTWDEVIAATKNGKYKNFEIGAVKEMDLGSEGVVHMQIVGIDADELADGSGKAPLTFISKELLKTSHRMNPARTPNSAPYNEGTGAIGGWEKCEMRTYLKETIKPLIPQNVRNGIKEVTKYSNIYNTSGTKVWNSVTTDDVWIPSNQEIFGGTSYETLGSFYSGVFTDKTTRKKCKVGEIDGVNWWLRTASTALVYQQCNRVGNEGYTNAQDNYAIALGFCL